MSKAAEILSGKEVGFPYSFSRWTDVCCSTGKWEWFLESLKNGYFIGFHPTEAIPYRWSLRPDDVLGLIFWTKDPNNLIWSNITDRGYNIKAHITVTGWEEVEGKAPKLGNAINSLAIAASLLGPKNVYWRFSPVPILPHPVIVSRFEQIAAMAATEGIDRVYLSFLQENDLMPETRTEIDRLNILVELAEVAQRRGIKIYLCNEDRLLLGYPGVHPNLDSGVCAPPEDFFLTGYSKPASEGCGCVLMVDPFTVNEACSVGCKYCLTPETLVLHDNFSWEPLGNIQVGDTLVGFDEDPPGFRMDRRFRHSVVEGVWNFRRPVIRVVTESNEVTSTAEHLWFEGKTRKSWKRTDHLALDCDLQQFGITRGPLFSSDYKAGYVAAMTIGDGTSRLTDSHRPKQPYWRVALTDQEPLVRLREYLGCFGVDVEIKSFDSGSKLSKLPMQKVETRSIDSIRILLNLDHCFESDEYKKGFLAGIFDSEGSYNNSLRVHQIKDNGLLTRVSTYASSLGIPMSVEGSRISARVSGGLRQYAKFFSLVQPAIIRKSSNFFGRSVDFSKDRIVFIEQVGIRDVIDIRTSSKTFLAAGLATHNCYAGVKDFSSKRRDTTKQRIVK